MLQKSLLILLSLLWAGSAFAADIAPPRYRAVEIDRHLILDGPHCLNDSGVAAGAIVVPPKPRDQRQYLQTYRWKNGHLTNLNIVENDFSSSSPWAINDRGQIVGVLDYGNGEMNFHSFGHAFFWERGKWQDLSALLPGEVSHVAGINSKGEVIINTQDSELFSLDYPDPGVQQPSYLYCKEQITFLGYKVAIALNNKSQVLLRSWDGHYYLWDAGETTEIGAFNDAGVSPSDMNDQDQIIGRNGKGPILWEKGHMTFLDPGRESYANSINNKGQIVGYVQWEVPDGPNRIKGLSHARLWQDAKIYDLNSLLPARSGWLLERAISINDRGMIVGMGIYRGKPADFLMTPIK